MADKNFLDLLNDVLFGRAPAITPVDTTLAQTITNKTLTSPTINTPTIANGLFTGTSQLNGAAAAAGAVSELAVTKVIADNTAVDFVTVTVPNAINVAGISVMVMTGLGDGDSAQMSIWNVAISRIAGAATGKTVSSVGVSATNNGATGNAATTVAASANTGANSASQTFTITIKNARSAGSATNHPTVAVVTLLNGNASGVTIAAA